MSMLDLLLKKDPKDFDIPEKTVYIPRLAELLGGDGAVTIKALSFERIDEINKMHPDDVEIWAVLNAVKDPDFRNAELMRHFGVVTPIDCIKKILRPGEIQGLYARISEHCGYGRTVLADIKKK